MLTYCAMVVVLNNIARGGLTLPLWLQAESRAKCVISFTQTPEYKKNIEFHLITGGSGAGISNRYISPQVVACPAFMVYLGTCQSSLRQNPPALDAFALPIISPFSTPLDDSAACEDGNVGGGLAPCRSLDAEMPCAGTARLHKGSLHGGCMWCCDA